MKRILCTAIVLGVLTSWAYAATWLPPAKYATQYTLYFEVYDSNSPWRVYETAPAAADVWVFQDGASGARATNAVTDLGRTFTLVLTAAEMTAAVVTVDVNDDTATPLFGDAVFYIPTYGHASAYHVFDISSANPTVTLNAANDNAVVDVNAADIWTAGAITATVIASNAFTSDELATSFISEFLNTSLQTYKTKKTWGWWLQQVKGGEPVDLYPSYTAQDGGTANTIKLAATSSATNNAYLNMLVELISGTGAPATNTVLSYNGTTKVATMKDNWPGTAPDSGTTYTLWAAPSSVMAHEGLAQDGNATTITLATDAPSTSSIQGWIKLRSGTGAPDTQEIVSYNGTTKVLTVTAWSGASPDGTTYYALIPLGNTTSDTTTPSAGLTVADVQSAMTAQGATTTLLTNLATVDTVAELATGLWNAATGSYGGAGTYGQALEDVLADTAAYDTDAEHAAAVWNAASASYGGVGTYGDAIEDITGSYDVDALYDLLWKVWTNLP